MKVMEIERTAELIGQIEDRLHLRKTSFTGTKAEWESLTTEEKAKYEIVNITDDTASGASIVSDAVTDGDLNPVTSNAVFDAMNVVTSGNGIRNATYVSDTNFIARWYKCGRICQVDVQYNLSQAVSSDVEIITGLPAPIVQIASVGEGPSNTVCSSFVIKKNGAVRTHYEGAVNQFVHGTATYITAE